MTMNAFWRFARSPYYIAASLIVTLLASWVLPFDPEAVIGVMVALLSIIYMLAKREDK